MLQKLEIKNYAIIEELVLELTDGLTIITGETGAGKSILLGALGLIMGRRADSKVLYDKTQKAVVEATFDVSSYEVKDWFEQHDLDYDDEVIIRRIIAPNGKSRAFLNDEPTTLTTLKSLTEELVDMHQQFDMLDIHSISFQTNTVDAMAGNTELMTSYRSQYQHYVKAKVTLQTLLSQQQQAQNEMEFLKFQMNEFEELALTAGEQVEKEQLLTRLNNSEDIQRVGTMIGHAIEESEDNLIDKIRVLANELDTIREGDAVLGELSERMTAVMEELADIGRAAADVADSTEYDGQLIQELSERLDSIYKLQQKHNVNNLTDLLQVQESIDVKLQNFGDLASDIAKQEAAIAKLHKELQSVATKVSKARTKVIPTIEKDIRKMLASLSMEHAQLQIILTPSEGLSPSGVDSCVFYFKANKGGDFNPLKDVASGGEISRLTLCLKSMIADATVLPTLIFDEIDTGVSGDVAGKMGQILSKLAHGHQVLSITHSPQIAAKADHHYFVYKEDKPDRTVTGVRKLANEDRITEIAKMLSGNPPSAAAVANATELLADQLQ